MEARGSNAGGKSEKLEKGSSNFRRKSRYLKRASPQLERLSAGWRR